MPVAAKPTLRAIEHLQHVTNSDKKCTCQFEVDIQRDCLEERFCFAGMWFWYRLFIASRLMSSQRTIFNQVKLIYSQLRRKLLNLQSHNLC